MLFPIDSHPSNAIEEVFGIEIKIAHVSLKIRAPYFFSCQAFLIVKRIVSCLTGSGIDEVNKIEAQQKQKLKNHVIQVLLACFNGRYSASEVEKLMMNYIIFLKMRKRLAGSYEQLHFSDLDNVYTTLIEEVEDIKDMIDDDVSIQELSNLMFMALS